MNTEEFDKLCKDPVDIELCVTALSRLINAALCKRGFVMHVPPRVYDDDILLERALRELKGYRDRVD